MKLFSINWFTANYFYTKTNYSR